MIGAPDYQKYNSVQLENRKYTGGLRLFRFSAYGITFKSAHPKNFSTLSLIDQEKGDLKLGSYLAGLWEGDGHIIVPKNAGGQALSSNTAPTFAITFHKKDLPLVLRLKHIIGGNIRYKDKENALVLTITARKNLVKVVQLLNSYLRTPKIYEFNLLISWLNYNTESDILIYSIDNSPLSSNSWLAGFLDADCGFKIRFTDKLKEPITGKIIRKDRSEVRIVLEQRQFHPKTNESYKMIMEKIALFFTINDQSVKLRTTYHNGLKEYWCIEVTSLSKLDILIKYLSNHPLLTSKSLDYKDWLLVYNMMLKNEHLTVIGKEKIKLLKAGINKNRTKFDWSHLNYLSPSGRGERTARIIKIK